MNKATIIAFWTAVAAACGGGGGGSGPSDTGGGGSDPGGSSDSGPQADSPNPPPVIEVTADITGDVTWPAGVTVRLKKHVFVENGTLTIEPGVTVLGESGTSLVITPSARIDAQGTKEAPIVFTSALPVGSRAAGDWGGVILLGKAPINVAGGSEKVEGFPATESRTNYGGTDATHDCGTLRYARIEFAGFELAPDNELNGLTMGGCGSKTVVDFVQVHKGADDGVEMFGGAADLRHIVVTQPDDDGLDWDFGWTGRVQFLIVQQNALVGDNGFECDNNKNDNDASPRSMPDIWNATLIGSNADPGTAGKKQYIAMFRRGTAGGVHNAVMAYFADGGITVNDASTVAQMEEGRLFVKNSIFFDIANEDAAAFGKSDQAGFDVAAAVLAAANSNRQVDPMLADPLNLTSPDFRPQAGSPALTGGATPPSDGFFDSSAAFVGAVGTEDWTAGWTAFPND